jgi:hypothetical protein
MLENDLDRVRMELESTKRQLEEKKQELAKVPRREISEQEREITQRQLDGYTKNAGLESKIASQKAYDDVLVTGKFINRRNPGKKSEKLTYIKYNTDPVKWYDFEDGKIYTIPRGFAEQIRDHYYMPRFVHDQVQISPDHPMSAIQEVDTSNKKYDFVPVNF